MPFLHTVERERNISGTAMNSTSSRSNAIMELKCYTKNGNNYTVNYFKILDLAGSERVKKAMTEKKEMNFASATAILNNF